MENQSPHNVLFKCAVNCSCGSTDDIRVIQYRDGWGKSAKGYHSEKHAVCRSCRHENHDTWRYVK